MPLVSLCCLGATLYTWGFQASSMETGLGTGLNATCKCSFGLVCLQDTDCLKNAKNGQEHVHAHATFEYNNLKSLAIHSGIPKLGCIAVASIETLPRECRHAKKSSEPNVLL